MYRLIKPRLIDIRSTLAGIESAIAAGDEQGIVKETVALWMEADDMLRRIGAELIRRRERQEAPDARPD